MPPMGAMSHPVDVEYCRSLVIEIASPRLTPARGKSGGGMPRGHYVDVNLVEKSGEKLWFESDIHKGLEISWHGWGIHNRGRDSGYGSSSIMPR